MLCNDSDRKTNTCQTKSSKVVRKLNLTIPLLNIIKFGETLSNCSSILKMLQRRKKRLRHNPVLSIQITLKKPRSVECNFPAPNRPAKGLFQFASFCQVYPGSWFSSLLCCACSTRALVNDTARTRLLQSLALSMKPQELYKRNWLSFFTAFYYASS